MLRPILRLDYYVTIPSRTLLVHSLFRLLGLSDSDFESQSLLGLDHSNRPYSLRLCHLCSDIQGSSCRLDNITSSSLRCKHQYFQDLLRRLGTYRNAYSHSFSQIDCIPRHRHCRTFIEANPNYRPLYRPTNRFSSRSNKSSSL